MNPEDFLSKEGNMEIKPERLYDFRGGIDLDEFRNMVAIET
jgi:hypothetical protein